MKLHRWEDIRKAMFTPEEREQIDREVDAELLEMDLRTLRERLGVTQVELAHAAEMAQPEVSRLERRADHRLSTLRRIVEALGGELEVAVKLGGKLIKLRGV